MGNGIGWSHRKYRLHLILFTYYITNIFPAGRAREGEVRGGQREGVGAQSKLTQTRIVRSCSSIHAVPIPFQPKLKNNSVTIMWLPPCYVHNAITLIINKQPPHESVTSNKSSVTGSCYRVARRDDPKCTAMLTRHLGGNLPSIKHDARHRAPWLMHSPQCGQFVAHLPLLILREGPEKINLQHIKFSWDAPVPPFPNGTCSYRFTATGSPSTINPRRQIVSGRSWSKVQNRF